MKQHNCKLCDRPRATEWLNNNHPSGCSCKTCESHCWREYNGICDEIDWRSEYEKTLSKLHALVSCRSDHDSIKGNLACITTAIINLKNPQL